MKVYNHILYNITMFFLSTICRRRELYNKKGRQFLREGKVSEARDCFNKCVNVTPQMALQVMKVRYFICPIHRPGARIDF